MDAISFVLGVNSSQLRSAQLKELINKSVFDSNAKGAKTVVRMFYVANDGSEVVFSRSVNAQGTSEYRLGSKVVNYADFESYLQSQNILIKARNFLVFQGDVENIASKSPKDLTKLVEQISGSIEFKEEYDRLRLEQDKALEQSTAAFGKKKGIFAELKQVKEQKDEFILFEKLVNEKMNLICEQTLFRLFYIENEVESLVKENEDKKSLSEELELKSQETEAETQAKKVDQGKIQKEHLSLEKKIKKINSELEQKNPENVKIDEQIRFINEKLKNLEDSKESLIQESSTQQVSISSLNLEIKQLEKSLQVFDETELKAASTIDTKSIPEYNQM